MKKLMIALVGALMIMPASALAANGDIAGEIYSTDIRAFINGVQVQSYNIGGKTAVVIEDILDPINYSYNDSNRTLRFFSLDPEFLKATESGKEESVGKVIGNIYETDIKTEIYGAMLTSHNIGGKTAVAIEDLGKDNEFSEIGGKYIWNGENRTINLEFMYDNDCGTVRLDNKADVYVDFDEELTEGKVEFKKDALMGGGGVHFTWPEWVENKDESAKINAIIPLVADIDGQSTLIGYHFYKTMEKDYWNTQGFTAFTYFYEDKLSKALDEVELPQPTKEDVINHYMNNRLVYRTDRFDAKDYSFLYMKATTNHGGTEFLLLVQDDGTYYDYSNDFESVSLYGNKTFDEVRIDTDEEKVYIHYDVDYVLDLKTGKLRKTE